ncbi:MAG: glycosyltransferase [Alphaproteobacteria bacterium]|nr:glycosyltransferase [Alphaproteobacteria bacterium]
MKLFKKFYRNLIKKRDCFATKQLFTASLDTGDFNLEKYKDISIAHVSTYNILCGIASYCKNLKDGLDTLGIKNDVIDGGLNIKQVNQSSEAEVIEYYRNIAEKCKNYDTVIIQHEYSFFFAKDMSFSVANNILLDFLNHLSQHDRIENILLLMHSSPDAAFGDKYAKNSGDFFPSLRQNKKIKFLSTNPHSTYILSQLGITAYPLILPIPSQDYEVKKDIQDIVKAKLDLQKNDIVLATIGFILKEKRTIDAVKVLKLLPDNYKLMIVGGIKEEWSDTYLSQVCDEIKSNNLEKRVFITGCYKDEDLNSYTSMTDIMLALYSDTFKVQGASINTMIATLKPTIAYNNDTYSTLNNLTPYKPLKLCKYDDLKSLKSTIEEVAGNDRLKKYMVEQAQGYISEKSIVKLAQLTLKAID